MDQLMQLISKGGVVMWPIAGAAFIALGIIIERSIFFILSGIKYISFKDRLKETIDDIKMGNSNGNPIRMEEQVANLKSAYSTFKWNNNSYVKIALTYFQNLHTHRANRDEALRRVGSIEIERMEKYFQGLSAISHATPLLGLLGTVTGIISSFAVIAELGGQVDVSALAGGIWEAMLTTAAGLAVAIPTNLAYLYFEKIVSSRSNRMSYVISYLNEKFLINDTETDEPVIIHDTEGEMISDNLG
jgi:biopolymer transport protein ExbB